MTSRPTTDCITRRWHSRGFCCLAAVLALLSLPSAAAADMQMTLELQPAALHMPQRAPKLRLSLLWPNACLPDVGRVAMIDDRIDIVLRAGSAACVAVPTPYEAIIDVVRAAGLTVLEPRVYGVRVHVDTIDRSAQLAAFGLLDVSGSRRRLLPENGFWWSVPTESLDTHTLSGSGISLERQGDRIAVTLLGYEAGQPAWYFGSSAMANAVARVPLMRMSGGGEPFSTTGAMPVAQSGPTLNITFETHARARAWLERPSANAEPAIELQEIALMHLPFDEGPPGSGWRGTWVFVQGESPTARVLELSRVRARDAETFRLTDADETLSLDCRNAATGVHAHPAVCTLEENAMPIATLDLIGFDRMTGHALDGSPVQLLRLRD